MLSTPLSRERLPLALLLMLSVLTAPLTSGLGGSLSRYLPPGRQGSIVFDKTLLDLVNYSLREEILTPGRRVDKTFRLMSNRGPAEHMFTALQF